jgi:pyruvate/2-oxoglutarate dehydrogenase complex dihydrolipoamide dehydrogenase (E3) component
MMSAGTIEADIAVIGAGSAGLSVAAGAAQLGASTVLVERGAMGGDCLNTGCVPSKALLAAGKAARAWAKYDTFGVQTSAPKIDFARVNDHVHEVIASIAPHDSVERFEGLGVQVIKGNARFAGPRELDVDGRRVRARRIVVATGSRASVPPIPGLDRTPFLTNESMFELRTLPEHLVVIGGGPIGLEMAEAHHSLGSRVTVVDQARVLPKDDQELATMLRDKLVARGIDIREGVRVLRTDPMPGGIAVTIADADGREERILGSHLLLAAGRQPNVEDLDLDAAGIAFGRAGIQVDARLRTTNRRIFAIGDVAGGPQFTHVAGYHAGIVIRNALFRLPAKVDYRALPWVTYTDPELAQVGLTEAQAREQHGDKVVVLRAPYEDNDRARAERRTEGLLKAVVDRSGRVLGASIHGAQAGELIQLWGLAISQKLNVKALAGMIMPYPTLGEVSKRAAGSFFTPKLFSSRTRGLIRFLSRFG